MPRRPHRPVALDPQLALLATPAKARPEPPGAAAVTRQAQRYADEPGVFFANRDSMAQYLREAGMDEAALLHDLVREQDYSAFGGTAAVGRRPYGPWILVGLIVYGIMRGLRSLRELERLAVADLGAMHICGGLRPDHSTIGLFLTSNAALLTEEFFVGVTRDLSRRLAVSRGTTAIDGTIVQAVASGYRQVTAEAAQLAAEKARELANANPEDLDLQRAAERDAEVAIVASFRQLERDERGNGGTARVSPTEPDAVVQPLKEGPVKAAYKPSIQVHGSGLIVGAHLETASEQSAVAPLLAQHEAIFAAAPVRTLLDAGYHDPGTLQQFVDRDVDVLCPPGKEQTLLTKRSTGVAKSDFSFDPQTNSYRCPQGRSLPVWDRFIDRDGRAVTRYRATNCDGCALRPSCCRGKSQRTVKRYSGDELKEAAASVMRHPEARANYARRKAIVEPVFARLKGRQRLRRFLRRGRAGAALEFALHCLAYNLGLAAKRLAALAALFVASLVYRLTCRTTRLHRTSAPGVGTVLPPATERPCAAAA